MTEEKLREFRKLIYEPEHETGGVCWCGVKYIKGQGKPLEIVHQSQKDLLTDFVRENFL